MDTLHTTPQLCLYCGYTLDAHINTTGRGLPKPKDFAICMVCAGILRYGEGLKVSVITLEEVPEEYRAEIEKVAAAVKTLRVTHPEWKPECAVNS